MDLQQYQYYHLYNRSNNEERIFKSSENFDYFLKNYQKYLAGQFDTAAYCLMPTHFHFLVYYRSEDQDKTKQCFATFLSSYTKALNIRYKRHGSLFQPRTKAKCITDESYLFTLISYIHQNPIRAGLVSRIEDWPHSSYREMIGLSPKTFLNDSLILQHFNTRDEFKDYSCQMLNEVREEFWV